MVHSEEKESTGVAARKKRNERKRNVLLDLFSPEKKAKKISTRPKRGSTGVREQGSGTEGRGVENL